MTKRKNIKLFRPVCLQMKEEYLYNCKQKSIRTKKNKKIVAWATDLFQ